MLFFFSSKKSCMFSIITNTTMHNEHALGFTCLLVILTT